MICPKGQGCELDWKTGDKEVWGRSMWIDVSECPPCASGEEDFNNQVGRMTCSVDAGQTLSQPSLSSLGGIMSKVAMEQGWSLCVGSAPWTPTQQGQRGYGHH